MISSLSYQIHLSAIVGIIQTFGVCIILSIASHFFSLNTFNLVINPIENMLERVKHISSDPLSAVHEEEERMLMVEL